ncbi:MAG: signal peptidase I [Hydrogenophaga sp.]|uniref:signal peptidase I n=1 Tax=Hydrogenophaga sp. TaxID=1904254 RepID=UPI0025C730F3|nr:signal peptidase I [Hydrogenophaga sp.]MBT9553681.1 signal peptidase I [Hydrogenophaga sp.]
MKKWLTSNRGFLVLMLCFGVFRTAIADWNPVPSGSMRPTILEGDVVLVNRLAYDLKIPLTGMAVARLGEPQRGDIVTFDSPQDGTRLIKRLVALPGDVVALHDGVLSINGSEAAYADVREVQDFLAPGMNVPATRATERTADSERTVQYLDGMANHRSFGPVAVPADHYFMMGDNRDNSGDSRFFGPVPRALLIARAERILVSADITTNWLPRWERFASRLQ